MTRAKAPDGPAYMRGFTARDLMATKFKPIRYVVPGVLPEGATLLAGAPKMGKSWLALGLAVSVASGGMALGKFECDEGDALYLALEDNERRLQARLCQMQLDMPDRLRFVLDWPDLDGACIEELEAWVHAAKNPALIVVDILARVRGQKGRGDAQYDLDYRAIAALQSLAGRHGVAILIVHHTSKASSGDDPFDAISGTRGLAGAADTIMILHRDEKTSRPVLIGKGRDLRDIEFALDFNASYGLWSIAGDASVASLTGDQQSIVHLLGQEGIPMGPSDIAARLGKERTAVQHMLTRLLKDGQIVRQDRGEYALPSL